MKHIAFITKLFTGLKSYTDETTTVTLTPTGLSLGGLSPIHLVAFFDTGLKNDYQMPFNYFRELPVCDIEEDDNRLKVLGVPLVTSPVGRGTLVQPEGDFKKVDTIQLKFNLGVAKALARHTKQLLQRNLLVKGDRIYYHATNVSAFMYSPFEGEVSGSAVIPPYVLELLKQLLTCDSLEYTGDDQLFIFRAKKGDLELYTWMKKRGGDISKFLPPIFDRVYEEPALGFFHKEAITRLKSLTKIKHINDLAEIRFGSNRMSLRLFDNLGQPILEGVTCPLIRDVQANFRISISLMCAILDVGFINFNYSSMRFRLSTPDNRSSAVVPVIPGGVLY